MTKPKYKLSASNSNLQRVIDRLNADRGAYLIMTAICKNKGFVFYIEDGREEVHSEMHRLQKQYP